jgi:hypothetical protein
MSCAGMNSRWPRRDGSRCLPAIRRTGVAGPRYESKVSNHHVNLTPQENSLIAEAHPDALGRMDSKSLKDLQNRLRNARDKNFSLLRRQGATRVEAEGARGAAQQANEKRGEKVEVFDEALARVNECLDAVGDAE